MNAQRGLGRGLGALIPTGQSVYREVPLSAVEVNPLQPRQHFKAASLEALSDSIRQIGVLQRSSCERPASSGASRSSRANAAGEQRERRLGHHPVVIRAADDETSLTHALIENVHRADLNPLEEAAAYRQLIDDFGVTHDELGRRMGRSRAAVTNSLRLLSLPVIVQRYLMDGELSAGHARALLGCDDPMSLSCWPSERWMRGWSVRTVEEAVRSLSAAPESGSSAERQPQKPANRSPQPTPTAQLRCWRSKPPSLPLWQPLSRSNSGAEGVRLSSDSPDLMDLARLYEAMNVNLEVLLEGLSGPGCRIQTSGRTSALTQICSLNLNLLSTNCGQPGDKGLLE